MWINYQDIKQGDRVIVKYLSTYTKTITVDKLLK